jgi:hypothetical protein
MQSGIEIARVEIRVPGPELLVDFRANQNVDLVRLRVGKTDDLPHRLLRAAFVAPP